jgi:hypothetical protein
MNTPDMFAETIETKNTLMECCKNPAQYNMHEFRYEIVDGKYAAIPCWNRICTNCFTHWYGHPDNLKRYTKQEWDKMIEDNFYES